MITESWFINAILITLAIGIVAFINKIFAERKYDQRFSAMVLFGVMTIFSLGYSMLSGWYYLNFKEIILIMIWGVGSYFYSIIMMTALRYLPTSTYFINVRLISSFVLLMAGIILFKDKISFLDGVGFIIGVFAMLLLFEKESKKYVNYKKGVIWLLFGAGTLIATHTVAKFFSYNLEAIPTILSIMIGASFLTAVIFGINRIDDNKKYFKNIFLINIIQAGLFFFYFVNLLSVYRTGALGISYKIQSYSPFVPIILAAIVYREKISFRKKIALVLVAVSLWFFK